MQTLSVQSFCYAIPLKIKISESRDQATSLSNELLPEVLVKNTDTGEIQRREQRNGPP